MCDRTEQHQKNGHRHHDHVMTNAARDKSERAVESQGTGRGHLCAQGKFLICY